MLNGRLTPVNGQPELLDVKMSNSFLGIDYQNVPHVFLNATRKGDEVTVAGSLFHIPATGLALTLDPTVAASQNVDIYAVSNSGTLMIGQNTVTWGNDWLRSNAAAAITPTSAGQPTNATAITVKNGITSVSVPAGAATLLGSIRLEGAGTYNMRIRPFQQVGGVVAKIGLYNVNTRKIDVIVHDSAAQWLDNLDQWIPVDTANGGSNIIFWLDGLGESTARFQYIEGFQGDGFTCVAIDGQVPTAFSEGGASLALGRQGIGNIMSFPDNIVEQTATNTVTLLGWHYARAVEYADGPADDNPVQQEITGLGAGNNEFYLTIEA